MSIRVQSHPNLIGQPVVEFRRDDYNAAIWNKGYEVILETAVRCPCKTENHDSLVTCQNCLGRGWFFINPLRTRALISGINKNTDYKEWSVEMIGTVQISVPDIHKISFMDRITLVNTAANDIQNRSVFSEVKRLRTYETNKPFIFLSYEIKKVKDIFVFVNSSTPLIRLETTDYSIRSQNGYTIEFDYDFDLITDFNGVVSVLYEHELQYHILDVPHDVRNSYIRDKNGILKQQFLPINAVARKAHYVLNVDNYESGFVIDNTYL